MQRKSLSESLTIRVLRKQSLQCIRIYPLRKYAASIQNAKPFKSIPGPSSLPYLGTLHHFLPGIGEFGKKENLFEIAAILSKRYGPIVRLDSVLSRNDTVFLFDPEYIEQVFRAQESNPLRRGFETLQYYRTVLRKDTFEGISGLSTAQGAQWRDFRTKVNPALLKIKLVRLYTPALEEIAQEFVERLKCLNGDDTYLRENFMNEANKWSLESTGFVALGARLGCLKDDLTSDHPASKLIKCAKDIVQLTYQLEFQLSPWRFITTPTFKKLINTHDTQWEVSAMYIEQARKQIKERRHDIPEEDKSIIEKLLAIDERVAIMMANEMLLAGIDTVSFTLTNVLYHLAINKEKQDKLRQEIRSNDTNNRYLKACIKEALRIMPISPANLRTSDKDHIVGGYHIPAEVDLLAMNQYMSRLEKYYPRPLEFIPERWLADKTDPLYYGNAHSMVTLSFGFGVRSCIGRRIAELEVETLIKKLIDEFKITWEGPPIKIVNFILNTFVKPFNFKFEKAE